MIVQRVCFNFLDWGTLLDFGTAKLDIFYSWYVSNLIQRDKDICPQKKLHNVQAVSE